MKKLFVVSWLCLLIGVVAAIFWYQEMVYKLPTPVPKAYKPVAFGAAVKLPLPLGNKKALFLHFYNPECPCTRFNLAHFKSLVKEYGNEVAFAVVPYSTKHYSTREIQEKIGLDIPVLHDDSLAVQYGVYSTPQAVIIDKNQHLYYRGNYNRTRYCSDKKTAYAQIALSHFLNQRTIAFDAYALKAYGCQLPTCTR